MVETGQTNHRKLHRFIVLGYVRIYEQVVMYQNSMLFLTIQNEYCFISVLNYKFTFNLHVIYARSNLTKKLPKVARITGLSNLYNLCDATILQDEYMNSKW